MNAKFSPLLAALLGFLPLAANAQNVAQSKSISASAAVVAGQPIQNVNDGSFSTWTAPASTPTLGFHYDIDFGKETRCTTSRSSIATRIPSG